MVFCVAGATAALLLGTWSVLYLRKMNGISPVV
jgi:hypothetical protein